MPVIDVAKVRAIGPSPGHIHLAVCLTSTIRSPCLSCLFDAEHSDFHRCGHTLLPGVELLGAAQRRLSYQMTLENELMTLLDWILLSCPSTVACLCFLPFLHPRFRLPQSQVLDILLSLVSTVGVLGSGVLICTSLSLSLCAASRVVRFFLD